MMIVLFGYTNEVAPTMDYVKKSIAMCPENPSYPELLKGAEDCWQPAKDIGSVAPDVEIHDKSIYGSVKFRACPWMKKDMFVRRPPILAPIVKEFLSLPTRTCQLRKYYPGQNALRE